MCLQLIRLDLYYADLSTDKSFSLNMLPSETLQTAASSSSERNQVSLVSSASPTTIWIKLGPNSYHLIRLSGEEETAALVRDLELGVPLIGWLDGDKTRPTDVVVQRGGEMGSLLVEVSGEGAENMKVVAHMETNRGSPIYGDVKLYTKSDGSIGYSVAMVMEDYTMIMLKPKGREKKIRNSFPVTS